MSRSYNKIMRVGICTGSNTEYYRKRNRAKRMLMRRGLAKIRKMDINDFADTYMDPKMPKKNTWDEPTDGVWYITKDTINYWKRMKETGNDFDKSWASKMIRRYKNKLKYFKQNDNTK